MGPKTVEITASRETGKKDPLGGMAREDYIPAKYNCKNELKAEVTDDGDNEFDFALTK